MTLRKKEGTKNLEIKMKKTLLSAAALVVAITAPALAQSYDSSIGTGNLDSAPYASNRYNPIHSEQANPVHHRMVRRGTPSDAYGQSPEGEFGAVPSPSPFGIGY
jgi:hypothetical protein